MGGAIEKIPGEELEVREIGGGEEKLDLWPGALELEFSFPPVPGESFLEGNRFEVAIEKAHGHTDAPIEVGFRNGIRDADIIESDGAAADLNGGMGIPCNGFVREFRLLLDLGKGKFQIGMIRHHARLVSDDGQIGEQVIGRGRPWLWRGKGFFVGGILAHRGGTAVEVVAAKSHPEGAGDRGNEQERGEGD